MRCICLESAAHCHGSFGEPIDQMSTPRPVPKFPRVRGSESESSTTVALLGDAILFWFAVDVFARSRYYAGSSYEALHCCTI